MTARKLIVNGLEIHVRIKGNPGNTILFIHGSSLSSGIWDAQFSDQQLSEQYQLIAIDLPGHGESSHATDPAVQYRFPELANCIPAIIDMLQLKTYILVGVSIGCNLIGEIALSISGCRGFFLAGAPLADRHIGLEKITLPFVHGAMLITPHPSDAALEDYCNGLFYSRDKTMLTQIKQHYRQADPAFRANLGNVLAAQDWSAEIAQLNEAALPIALVYGEQEQIVSTSYLRGEIQPLWRNDIILIAAAGHLVNADQPAIFNQLLLSFAAEQL